MALSLENIERYTKLLQEYKGDNPYILSLKTRVTVYKTKTLNKFDAEYINYNYDKQPKEINKIVKVADWWGEKKQKEWSTEFQPSKIKITWFLGETNTMYHFYCIYRKSQKQAVEVFCIKQAILTDFKTEDWKSIQIDFSKYNEKSGRTLFPHQEDAVRFLVYRKRAILADSMGLGKSFSAIVSTLESDYKKVLIICPASLKKNWENELSYYVDHDDITIVEGREWKENRFTIINYDILKNFYEVPTENVERNEFSVDDNGKIVKVTKEKKVVSRKKDVISQAMENSQLFQSKFDCLIIDEAHRLSNTTSGIYKIVSDLVKRSEPKGIFELSGTIVTNRPINLYNMLKIIDAPIAKDWKNYVLRYCEGKKLYKKNERTAYTKIFLKKVNKSSWYDLTQEEKNELEKLLDWKCGKIWITNGASNIEELQELIKPYYLRRDKTDLELTNKTVKTIKYDLTEDEIKDYNKVWDEYIKDKKDKSEQYRRITEGSLLRIWCANAMVSRTIELTEKLINEGHKVVIFCTFNEELNAIKEAFKDICVVHNGQMSAKEKEKSVKSFQTDENVKVFIGNLISAGVGLTLTVSDTVVFNSIDYTYVGATQAEDRIHRLNQTKDCTIYYQLFNNTYMEHVFEIVDGKMQLVNKLIINEREK